MGKSQQRKGRRAEIELSGILNSYGYMTRPGVAVSFGKEPDVVGLDGVHVEVKRRENTDIPAALKQAAEDAERFGDGLPAVFFRGNRQKWRVIMELDSWLVMYRKFIENKIKKGVRDESS